MLLLSNYSPIPYRVVKQHQKDLNHSNFVACISILNLIECMRSNCKEKIKRKKKKNKIFKPNVLLKKNYCLIVFVIIWN